ncbi:MAG: hypothetical protein HUU02_10665 [Bacteroidetes bacterium]|nr:hypothetical protein [Bacteroidota bacterium]
MTQQYMLLFLVAAALLDSGCTDASSGSDDVASATPKYDLTVGNYWIYSLKGYNDQGIVTNSSTVYFTVVRDTFIEDKKWSLLSIDTIPAASNVSRIAIEQHDGYYERVSIDVPRSAHRTDTSMLIYQYPAPTNSFYAVNPRFGSDGGTLYYDTTRIVARNRQVSVPAGSFRCYQYTTNNNFISRDSHGKEGVFPSGFTNVFLSDSGMVKIEAYTVYTGQTVLGVSLELLEFKIQK